MKVFVIINSNLYNNTSIKCPSLKKYILDPTSQYFKSLTTTLTTPFMINKTGIICKLPSEFGVLKYKNYNETLWITKNVIEFKNNLIITFNVDYINHKFNDIAKKMQTFLH